MENPLMEKGAGLKIRQSKGYLNKGKGPQVFYDKARNPIIVMPGEALFAEWMEKYDIPRYLIAPELWEAQREAESILSSKGTLEVLIDASKVDRYGDNVMLTVIPKAYNGVYEEKAFVDVLCTEKGAVVWDKNPYVRRLFSVRPDSVKYDVVLDVNGLELKWQEKAKDLEARRNRTELYLENLGLFLFDSSPVYVVTEEEKNWAKEFCKDYSRPIVAVQWKASCPLKSYPHMKEVVDLLGENYDVVVIDHPGLSFRDGAALVERADVVVALDSAYLHVAGALKKRIVAVYGNVDGAIYTEDYEKVTVIQGKCSLNLETPCWWSVPCVSGPTYQEKEKAGTAQCLAETAPQKIVNAVVEHLEKPKRILAGMLTYNLLDMTKKAIASLRSWNNLDLFVVDNESTDGTQEWLKANGIEYVSKRQGVPNACNDALRKFLSGGYDYFLLLNNDVVLRRDTVETLLSCLERSRAWAATSTPLMNVSPWKVNSASLKNRGWAEVIDIAPGAYSCTLFTRECIEKVGMFDERFGPRYIEDNDYTLRIRLEGGHFVISFQSGYYHALGAVLNSNDIERRNADTTWKKNLQLYFDKWGIMPHEYQDLKKVNGKPKPSTFKAAPSYCLLSQAHGYGDHVFLTPVAKAIKKQNPQSHVSYAVPSKMFDVYKGNPYIDHLQTNGEPIVSDIVIDCTDLDYKEESREVEVYGGIKSSRAEIFLRAFGLPFDDLHPEMFVGKEELEWAEAEWGPAGTPRMAVGVKASNLIMTWPHTQAFLRTSIDKNKEIVCRYIELDKQISGKFLYTFRQATALIATASLYVGPNSGFSNVAGALNIPAITLFSYRNGEVMKRMYPSMVVIQGRCSVNPSATFCDYKAPCFPGNDYRSKENIRPPSCIQGITPERVMEEVRKVLKIQ